jgi:hypothetical protein
MNGEPPPTTPVNRNALISMIAGLLTLLSFCTAVAPVPLTGYVCFPAAALSGFVAVVSGTTALAQIRRSREQGRPYALIGISVGALALLATLCAGALGIFFFPKVVALIRQAIESVGAVGH